MATAKTEKVVEESKDVIADARAKFDDLTEKAQAQFEEASEKAQAQFNEAKEQANEAAEKLNDLGRKALRVNLGIYGRLFDESKARFEEVNTRSSEVFEELVARGEKVEADAKARFEELRAESEKTVQERIDTLKEGFEKLKENLNGQKRAA